MDHAQHLRPKKLQLPTCHGNTGQEKRCSKSHRACQEDIQHSFFEFQLNLSQRFTASLSLTTRMHNTSGAPGLQSMLHRSLLVMTAIHSTSSL